jgi:hypothetical protein
MRRSERRAPKGERGRETGGEKRLRDGRRTEEDEKDGGQYGRDKDEDQRK